VSWDKINQNWSEYNFLTVDAYLEGDEPLNFYIELRDQDNQKTLIMASTD